MTYKHTSWEEALKNSHLDLLEFGPRSNKKLIYPHKWIKETIRKNLKGNYELHSLDPVSNSREETVKGLFYDKNVDITIKKHEEVLGAVSFKFVASNYSQNSNNYFENLLGECYNIQANKIPFCHIFVVRKKIPYYDKEKNVKRYESLTEHNLDKYLKLIDIKNDAVPSKIAISIVDIQGDDYRGNIIHPIEFKKLDLEEQRKIINSLDVSLSNYDEYNQNIRNKLNSIEINKVLKEFSELIE